VTGRGTCRRLVCPYHAWSYDLDGRLAGAPGMDQTPGFDTTDWPLRPVRLESWQGFLFVCFAGTTPPLRDYLGDLTDQLGSYGFADFVTTRRVDYEVACNWKLLAENAMEAYHTGTVHGGSLGQQTGEQVRTRGHWDALFIAQETSIAVLPGEAAPFDHVATLKGRAKHGTYFTMLHPNTQFACTQDAMWWLTFRPLAADRTVVQVGQCFPRQTAARPGFAAEAKPYYRRWDTGIEEDNAIGLELQAGLSSPLHAPGRYSARETATHSLANWLLDQVVDDDLAARRI
jgi:phenylpropionate dioxygenase-like ring-hydroxylating dioxygenase large terminal subunit